MKPDGPNDPDGILQNYPDVLNLQFSENFNFTVM